MSTVKVTPLYRGKREMTNPRKRHIIPIMDRSGSIGSILSDMQGGYDQFIADQLVTDQQEGLTTTASLYQFDEKHDQLFSFAPLAELKSYKIVPRGWTALLDAVGTALVKEGEALAALPEDQRPGKVVVLIASDGKENYSKEYSKAQVAAMVTAQQEKYGWVIIYNGANQDAFAEAGGMGISGDTTLDYMATPEGTQSGWAAASASVSRGAQAGGSYAYTDAERAAAKGSGA
jgi:hypothetical protein